MLHSIKNLEELANINELVSLRNQVQEVQLQEKKGKQNFQEDTKKLFEPLTDIIKNTSEKLAKTKTESSLKNNKNTRETKRESLTTNE